MITLRKLLGERYRQDGFERISDAYKAMFSGHGSQEDADLVMDDLLQFAGYALTTNPMHDGNPVPAQVVWHAEGMKAVLNRVLYMVDIDHATLRQQARDNT